MRLALLIVGIAFIAVAAFTFVYLSKSDIQLIFALVALGFGITFIAFRAVLQQLADVRGVQIHTRTDAEADKAYAPRQ